VAKAGTLFAFLLFGVFITEWGNNISLSLVVDGAPSLLHPTWVSAQTSVLQT
jgi:hypothetical protein